MKNSLKKILALLLICELNGTSAQTTLQVATKLQEKEFEGIQNINFDTEKADIEIVVWNKSKVSVEVSWSAKHPEKERASKDLNNLKIEIIHKNNTLSLRNFLLLNQKEKKPESNFKTKFILKIPEKLNIQIKNNFGKISIQGKMNKLHVNTDFCYLNIIKAEGNSIIKTKFGEINVDGLDGKTLIKSEHTNVEFKHYSGHVEMNCYYGAIDFYEPTALDHLTVLAEKSDIKLSDISIKKYNLSLKTSYGKLFIPPELGPINLEKYGESARTLTPENPKIKIVNKIGNITVLKK